MRHRNTDFEVSIQNRDLRGLPEIKIQQQIANWKAESRRFSISKKSAPEDTSIASYGDFEPTPPAKIPAPSAKIKIPR